MSGTDNEGIRLNKYIASSGLCSRREADTLIESGKVTINGETAVQGSKVMDGDIVLVNGRKVTPDDDMVYIAFNKPSGLILLTNDGSIVNKLLRAENGHEKEYLVTVNRPYDKNFLRSMESGVPVLGQLTLPCKLKPAGDKSFKIILHQGLNRQIRRMCEYLGYKVTRLKRIRFMNIELGGLETGKWRYLTSSEKKELLKDI